MASISTLYTEVFTILATYSSISRILAKSDVGVFSSNLSVTHFLQVKEYDLLVIRRKDPSSIAFFPLTKKGGVI